MENKDWPPIWIGLMIEEDLFPKSSYLKDLERELNAALDLSDYGTGLEALRFVPLVFVPEDRLHEENTEYLPGIRRLTFWRKLDYAAARQADTDTFPRLIARLFLDALPGLAEESIPDFDWQRFQADARQVLGDAGWVET